MDSQYYINKLKLKPHPEGGYYKEIYKSKQMISQNALGNYYSGDRSCGTAIYYLLEKDDFSCFHRVKSDELWHHYDGATIELHMISPQGEYTSSLVGKDDEGAEPFAFVPAGYWFAAGLLHNKDFALTGCTVSPGFEFDDFEMAKRPELVKLYPKFKELIIKYTK
ncbi:MAG: cupin domain-containing protein [Bacteroidales bacterium]